MNLFNIALMNKEGVYFFMDIIKKTLRQRETEAGGQRRNDFVDLMCDTLKESKQHQDVEDDQFEKDAQVLHLIPSSYM